MARRLLSLALVTSLALSGRAAAAQGAGPAAPAPGGPTLSSARAAAHAPMAIAPVAADDVAAAAARGPGFGREEALMIVGGAAFLAGAIIGEDAGAIVMIGGAAIGLYGLYIYLQQ
ncbi:MAG TPA: hypothetical protein VNA89_06610 [Gemmatimonadaceae bacterium]|nr:hypothetical protein [Gemmatimonadaceae bacterium]